METKTGTLVSRATTEVLITRVFDAPRELVFKAWSDPEYLARWYAPNNCTISIYHMNFRKGGMFIHCIHVPHMNYECICSGIYKEIEEPGKIVFSIFHSDEKGNLIEPSAIGADPEWPREMVITVKLEDIGGKTKMTLHQTVRQDLAERTGAYPSWLEMFDKLNGELTK